MRRVAFIFPGQGAQVPGMARALAEAFPEARAALDAVDDALGEKLSALMFDGPADLLTLTANAQPALLAASAAAHAVFASRGPAPLAYAGHSLGEYSALVAAGALSLADAARAVRARGTFMQEAVPAGQGAMAAVLGLAPELVEQACREVAAQSGEVVSPANYNSPEQTVVAGSVAGVALAGERAKALGAKRVLPLPVSAPFHCALMQPAQDRLAANLQALHLAAPAIPVAANVDAVLVRDANTGRDALVRQVTGAVRWVECVNLLIGEGVAGFIEVGPGKVLCGLMRQIDRAQKCLNVEDSASLEKTLAALAESSAQTPAQTPA